MTSSILSIVGSAATIALIAAATRWLVKAKGRAVPRIREGNSEYGIKWQWRVLGLVGAFFWVALLIWIWRDLHSRPGPVEIEIAVLFVAVGVWLANGSVSTNDTGITKRSLWSSSSFQWKEITEVRLHKRDGGAIEVRSDVRKIVIDTRFEASQYLLNEIKIHTQIEPHRD
jgi:hypothetical protein